MIYTYFLRIFVDIDNLYIFISIHIHAWHTVNRTVKIWEAKRPQRDIFKPKLSPLEGEMVIISKSLK